MREIEGVRWKVYQDEDGWGWQIFDDRYDMDIVDCGVYSDRASALAAVEEELEQMWLFG